MRKGMTIVETLSVVAIIVILGAIVFTVASPARESARRTTCKTNLRQIYLAMEMYAGDHGSDGQVVNLSGIPLLTLKLPGKLRPYLKDKRCMHCPDTPARAKEFLATSYVWRPIGKHLYKNSLGLVESDLDRIDAEANEKGGDTPIVQCFIHDELVEMPKEGDVDGLVTEPFVVELHANGKITSGKRPYKRVRMLSAVPK